jgi:hypothetical protein
MARTPEDCVRVGRTVTVEGWRTGRHHLEATYLLDGRWRFLTRVLYHDLDLDALAARVPASVLRRLWCHAVLFEGMRFMAVFPRVYDCTAIADGLDAASLDAFRAWVPPLWSQHLFENDVTGWDGPEMICRVPPAEEGPHAFANGGARHVLCANGGGKDSWLVMKTLERAGIPHAAFQVARSEYGRFDVQHEVHARALRSLPQVERLHRVSVHDDFTDGVFMSLHNPDLRGDVVRGLPCQVGSPEMIFHALPLALAHGYDSIALGNEKSADVPQARFAGTGEAVNHQWLKSMEAEALFDALVSERLLAGFRVFSLLRPLYDHRIYRLFAPHPEALADIHSCNVEKPWCRRCAKCAYVWIQLVATFGRGPVDPHFGRNLLDDPDLALEWRRLLGLEDRNAFECVGTTAETRLAFRTAHERGVRGAAMEVFRTEVLERGLVPDAATEADLARLHGEAHRIPRELWEAVRRVL